VKNQNDYFINEMEYRNDKLYLILRGHLYIENELIDLIDGYIPNAQKLDLKKMSFYNKSKLALSLNLVDEETLKALLDLNDIRNNYAHNLRYQVSEEEIDNLRLNISKIIGFEIFNEKFVIGEKNDLVIDLKACIVGVRSLLHQKAKSVIKEEPTYDLTKLDD
jgi:hypothetical protein